jgi:O-methyltransferase
VTPIDPAAARYLELLKLSVTGTAHEQSFTLRPWQYRRGPTRYAVKGAAVALRILSRLTGEDLAVVGRLGPDRRRELWPLIGESMIGKRRLDHLQSCVEAVLRDDVAGDLIETGVWRGGAAILMRAVLAANGVSDRTVWLADSFAGLPPPDERQFPADRGSRLYTVRELRVPLEEVVRNFERYGLHDEQVRFVSGWFSDTLPTLRGHRWAVLRMDADMYQSTREALVNLYPSLEPGGFAIVDDYGILSGCRKAVDEFRAEAQVEEPLEWIDRSAVFWRRARR